MGKLEGKIAVVTGGNSGIGLATAEAFVVEGAYVFVTGRRQAELDAAVAHIGSNLTAVQGDVSKPEDLDRLYRQVKHEKGKIDVLFANAGIGNRARLGEITDKHIDDLLCAEQVFYFDADGLLRRHDYIPDVIGWGPVAHYTSEHREFDGIMVPTRRRVYPVDPDGNVEDEPLVVAIDLDSVKFS